MELRIVGGRLRGKKLQLPKALETFRPTRSRVREAIASAGLPWTAGASVLELCAGSGAFAFEILSRGAAKVTAVELDRGRAEFISEAAIALGVEESITVVEQDCVPFCAALSTAEQYDMIFFDPPYYSDTLTALLPQLFEHLTPGGLCLFEAASDDTYIESISVPASFSQRQKRYGATTLYYFEKE